MSADDATTSTTVVDETRIFWLQRQHNTKNNPVAAAAAPPMLTEAECPLPSVEAVLSTAAPFSHLARRDTEYLSAFAPSVVKHRDAVCTAKHSIDGIQGSAYTRIRDRLFPLARSGAMSNAVGNRAAHKLLESMQASGITQKFFPNVPRPEKKERKKKKNHNNSSKAKRAGNDQQQPPPTAAAAAGKDEGTTAVSADTQRQPKAIPRIKASELVFVDVCGGPGSFAQALLCHIRKPPKMKLRGYGMTLQTADVAESLTWYPKLVRRRDFTPTFGLDGTGSVYLPENVEALCSLCASERQLLFVMGDGGFDVDPDKITMQESITGRLVFSQWYIALRLLKQGGALVLKLFETSSVFLRSMLTLSCLFFTHVAVVKPAHSRVVNSERYLACRGFRAASLHAGWVDFFRGVHARCFSDDTAPFTLLPNLELNPSKFVRNNNNNNSNGEQQKTHPLFSILNNLEESIVTTASRQTVALGMIEAEYNRRMKEEAHALEEDGGERQYAEEEDDFNDTGREGDDDDALSDVVGDGGDDDDE